MPKKIESIKKLEFSFREKLLEIFYQVPVMPMAENPVRIRYANDPAGRHNYQRDEVEYMGHYFIEFKDLRLGELWLKPKKTVKIYERYDHDRLYAKVLERVVRTYIPEATIEMVYGE